MTDVTTKNRSLRALAATTALGALLLSVGAVAQPAAQRAPSAKAQPTPAPINSATSLRLPDAPKFYRQAMPSIVKASALVNGTVITQTDIDHRVQLMAISNGEPIPANELEALRQQVLSNLIDETLQVQAAKRNDIVVTAADLDRALTRVATQGNTTPAKLTAYLAANGSSIDSVRRQIEGEIAWGRLQRARIEDNVSVGDDEVQAVIDKLQKSKGSDEYRVGEIYLAMTAANRAQVTEKARSILAALSRGDSFAAYARQYSEASTAAVGGDLGWVRPEMLPAPLDQVVKSMRPNSVSNPIEGPGGISILAVQDVRKIGVADPRAAVLNLKQVTIPFPRGATRAQVEGIIDRFTAAAASVGGCGGADKLAADFGGQVVQSDNVALGDLPAGLQGMVAGMQVGQAVPPFGSVEEGARTLVLCGRDQPQAKMPTFDEVYNQLNEERVNLSARRFLRDLRRDAIIEYR